MLYSAAMQQDLLAVEQALPRYLPAEGQLWDTVSRAMAYACEAGGKRLRPVLVLAFCRLCGGTREAALPFACAMEMIHSYSLVHDDLPCMDNSPLRRGKPSVHAAFGEDMALLAGDALLGRAFETMLNPAHTGDVPPAAAMAAAFTLAEAAGIEGMVGGQTIDLESEGREIGLPVLEALQEGKTAALLTASCRMGAQLAGASSALADAAAAYGRELGLCFQIVDDILDVTSTAEQMGKPVGSDEENRKTTYISLLGLAEARRLAEERTAAAIRALAPFGEAAEELRALAGALLRREK